MTWILIYTRKAEKQLRNLAKSNYSIYKKIDFALKEMLVKQDPFLGDTAKLSAKDQEYRLRIGNYRIVFICEQSTGLDIINIVKIEKKGDHTYKK